MNFSLFEDRIAASKLDLKIRKILREHGATKTGNIERVHFCGIIVNNNEVTIFAPRNSLSTNPEPVYTAALILNTLNKYNSSSIPGSNDDLDDQDEQEGIDTLTKIIWLLNDYTKYGLYTTSLKSREVNTGKTNWNRTINKETPFPGANGTPTYLRLHSERIKYGEQSLISLIHAEVIRELDLSFCWTITGGSKTRISPELDFVNPCYLNLEQKLHALKKELSITFKDRETQLLLALIGYLESNQSKDKGKFIIGSKTFHNVWESMLRSTLPQVINVNSELPKPALHFQHGGKPALAKGMLTDIVIKNENTLSIIDAKYYKGETPTDSPGWSDIVKQFFYEKALSKIYPTQSILNWFAFPGSQETIISGPIKYITMQDKKSGENLNEEFRPINCAYFCPINTMEKYANSSRFKQSEVNELFNNNNDFSQLYAG